MYEQPVTYTDNYIYAKCKEDWKFYDADRNIIIITDFTTADPNLIDLSTDWYRFQKDPKKNNITIWYKSTPEDPIWCPTRAKLRILARHQRLQMEDNEPLAVYRRNRLSARGSYILRDAAEERMNRAGKACHSNLNVPCTKKWTLHSCRIGAVALLFARFRDPELIMYQLRWDSDKWREYIRHTPILAGLHAKALVDVDTDDLYPKFD